MARRDDDHELHRDRGAGRGSGVDRARLEAHRRLEAPARRAGAAHVSRTGSAKRSRGCVPAVRRSVDIAHMADAIAIPSRGPQGAAGARRRAGRRTVRGERPRGGRGAASGASRRRPRQARAPRSRPAARSRSRPSISSTTARSRPTAAPRGWRASPSPSRRCRTTRRPPEPLRMIISPDPPPSRRPTFSWRSLRSAFPHLAQEGRLLEFLASLPPPERQKLDESSSAAAACIRCPRTRTRPGTPGSSSAGAAPARRAPAPRG